MDTLSVKRRLSCILAADAVGYSRHMGRDEMGTVRVLSAHRAVIDGIIAFHEGRIVGTAGDSVLAEFSSVVEAVRCAVEIQEAIKTRNDSLPQDHQLHFRVGINLGDVVVRGNDLLGDGINVAARLETMAEPGGICISSGVYDQITGKLDLGFQDIGEQNLKNITRPVHVYRISGSRRPTQANPPPAPSRKSRPWLAGTLGAAVIAALFAWQSGWVRLGTSENVPPPVKGAGAAVPAVPAVPAIPAIPAIPATLPVPLPAHDAPVAKAAPGIQPLPEPTPNAISKRRADAMPAHAPAGSVEMVKRQTHLDFARARAEARAARPGREFGPGEANSGRPSPSDTTIVWRRRHGESGRSERRAR